MRSQTSACSATTPTSILPGATPLEAAAQGITLGTSDWAVRCNLVTIENQIMVDFTADHISTEEATQLLQSAQSSLLEDSSVDSRLQFVPGVSYRNLLIYRGETGGSRALLARDSDERAA